MQPLTATRHHGVDGRHNGRRKEVELKTVLVGAEKETRDHYAEAHGGRRKHGCFTYSDDNNNNIDNLHTTHTTAMDGCAREMEVEVEDIVP